MAKKQTRRSISVSRTTYERLKAFCETSGISMSQFVETRVGDFLSTDSGGQQVSSTVTLSTSSPGTAAAPTSGLKAQFIAQPKAPTSAPAAAVAPVRPTAPVAAAQRPQAVPMTSAAARYAVDPPPPMIKQKNDAPAPKPAEKRPDQIFTF